MTYLKLVSRALCVLLLTPAIVHAQDSADTDRQLTGRGTIGLAAIPEYEGADEHRIVPLVDGRLQWGNRYLAVEGTSLRANVMESEHFEFGPAANVTFGRDAKIKSTAVAALGRIDDAYEIGAFAAFSLPLTANDRIRLALQAVHDVSNTHNGLVVSANASYVAAIGDRTVLSFDLGSSFVSADYGKTYFSVSPAGSTLSGLPMFNAGSGIKDVGASVAASFHVTGNWSLVGYAGYRRLLGKFADTPIVSRAGNADQFSGGVGISHAF